jgi:hypothetical protein
VLKNPEAQIALVLAVGLLASYAMAKGAKSPRRTGGDSLSPSR